MDISLHMECVTAIAETQINQEFEAARGEVEALNAQVEKFSGLWDGWGSDAEQSLGDLARRFVEGDASAEEFYLGLQDVRNEMNGLERAFSWHSGTLAGIIDQFEQGALKAIAFGNAVDQVVAQSHALAGLSVDQTLSDYFDPAGPLKTLETLKALTPELRSIGEITDAAYQKGMSNPQTAILGIGDDITAAYEAARAAQNEVERRRQALADGRSGAKSFNQWDNATESFMRRIEQQRMEMDLLGQSTFEIERQRAAFDLLSQAKQANVQITDPLIQQINQMSAEYAGLAVEMEQAAMVQAALDEQMQFSRATFNEFFTGFAQGLREGEGVWESFGNAAVTALDRIADRAFGFTDFGEDVITNIVDGETLQTVSRNYYGDNAPIVKMDPIPMKIGLSVDTTQVVLNHLHPAVQLMTRGYDIRNARVQIHRGYLDPVSMLLASAPRCRRLGQVNTNPTRIPEVGGQGDTTLRIVSHTRELTKTNPAKRSDETQRLRDGDRFRRYSGTAGMWDIFWGEEKASQDKSGSAKSRSGGILPRKR